MLSYEQLVKMLRAAAYLKPHDIDHSLCQRVFITIAKVAMSEEALLDGIECQRGPHHLTMAASIV